MPKVKNTKALKYETEMREFLSIMKWTKDEVVADAENQQIQIVTGLDLDGQNGRLIIEANSDNDIFDFYIYYTSMECKASKWEQMELLMNKLNWKHSFGYFECFEDSDGDRNIRWTHRVDFEGSKISGASIRNNFQPGWDRAKMFASVIAAVALTNQTAKDAIADFDREREEAEKASKSQETDNEGPTEL